VWTPWGTLLFAEEAIAADLPDPQVPQATSGLLYELTLNKRNPMKARSVKVRPMLGSLSHEGIELDSRGNVYVIDEDRRGSIYRFVPTRRGDLSAGQLQVLKTDAGKTGTATWVDLDMAQAQISARVAAAAVEGTQFCRPEDLERIGQTLYAALTCEDVTNPANTNGPGAIVAVTLGSTPTVHYAVAPGVNAPQENKTLGITGLRAVDNLANGPDGKLWIVEDNVPADIWVADVNANRSGYAPAISLFASLKDPGAEGTGIYFGRDPHTLFVNTQHSVTGNDGTYAITNRRAGL
jgi:secreted PhoX family phosphatase